LKVDRCDAELQFTRRLSISAARRRFVRMKPALTLEDAIKMAAASKAAGVKIKREPTIAVVDSSGHLLYLERPDHNGVNTVELATLKARTAALRGRPSGAFAARVQEKAGFLMMPDLLGVEGGIPILHEKECIGAIAVSGIDQDDEPVAKAGAQAFGG
jgi:glc operon protein GlcG